MVSAVPMAPMAKSTAHSLSQTPTIAKPVKPLLRRATLSGTIRTRDEAELDLYSDTMSAPPSPSKRPRTVTFNPLVEEQIFSSSPSAADLHKNLEITRLEVRRALDDHARGTKEGGYDALKELFSPKTRLNGDDLTGNTQDMKSHLLALTTYVSLLGRTCSGLVRAILDCEWVGRDETFVKIYMQFLGNLATAQGSWVDSILNMLVDKFTGFRISQGRLPDSPALNRDQLLSRIHGTLKYLLRLIPSASGTLAPILSSKFPLSDDTKRVHMAYIDNLLRLIEYTPELKTEVFALITDRLVKIDVQMQVDLDDMDDEVAAAVVQASSLQSLQDADDSEEEDDDESDADSTASDDSVDDEERRVKAVHSNVEKMDAMLDTLFTTYAPYFVEPDHVSAKIMFEALLVHFRNIILPTYRSRHTQFLLFHFAQTSEDLIDSFTGECISLAFNSGESAVVKQSAAAYLASFVSRGAHVPSHVVRDIFQCIGHNLDATREKNEPQCRGPDLQRYSSFYALTQALLYIFCFRWRDLIITNPSDDGDFDDDDFIGRDLEWYPDARELITRTVRSKLNPLKICAPEIVEEFAKIAHRLKFLYVYPILELNKRITFSQFSVGVSDRMVGALRDSGFALARNRSGVEGSDEESWHQLDAYFPFDPYQLPVSRKWIEGDYVSWQGIPGYNRGEEDGDTSDGSDMERDEDEDLELDTATDDDDDEMN